MTDPFDALRRPVVPVDPDPDFAATLRARIGRALALPRGVAVTSSTLETAAAPELGAAIPYLAVPAGEGRRALAWYADAFGAVLIGEPYLDGDTVGHAELAIGAGRIYLAEAYPELGVVAPRPDQTSVSLVLTVPDAAVAMATVLRAGGRLHRPMYDDYGSRNAWVVDPFGHRWLLQSPLADLPPAFAPGDGGYAWLSVPDVERAVAFYGAVLGWTVTAGSVPGGRNVEGRHLGIGLGGGAERTTLNVSWAVEDVAAAVERVRAAGGTASGVEQRPYGPAADCVDDQGMPFALHQAGGAGSRPPANGAAQGDLSYLTLEFPDADRARAFYAAVLGWTYQGGNPVGIVPMTGISGGHDRPTGVPMWKVDDVAAAVERVRSAGGTATDPTTQPYGVMADCTDDQGTHFYLGDA